MSSSSKGTFAWTSGKPGGDDAPDAQEWQPTRAHVQHETPPVADEWQPTRAFTRARQAATPPGSPGNRPGPRPRSRPSSSRTRRSTSHGEQNDIGRQTGANERELFVSCDPAQAMQQQFEHLQPEFIADPRHRDGVVAQAPARHRRGERPRGAEAGDPAPGLRHAARHARVRRAADRRRPLAAALHHRGRRRHRRAPRPRADAAGLQPPRRA